MSPEIVLEPGAARGFHPTPKEGRILDTMLKNTESRVLLRQQVEYAHSHMYLRLEDPFDEALAPSQRSRDYISLITKVFKVLEERGHIDKGHRLSPRSAFPCPVLTGKNGSGASQHHHVHSSNDVEPRGEMRPFQNHLLQQESDR